MYGVVDVLLHNHRSVATCPQPGPFRVGGATRCRCCLVGWPPSSDWCETWTVKRTIGTAVDALGGARVSTTNSRRRRSCSTARPRARSPWCSGTKGGRPIPSLRRCTSLSARWVTVRVGCAARLTGSVYSISISAQRRDLFSLRRRCFGYLRPRELRGGFVGRRSIRLISSASQSARSVCKVGLAGEPGLDSPFSNFW